MTNFPNPSSWYAGRLAFSHSCAVMSMVGYIVGLGDRHGENILLDGLSGDAVHVDFNCLFNKGETFATKEVVPFRLTNNMVDALGVTGVEGVFRRTCEVTLRLLRKEFDSLMSVLTTFVYDPMVEWNDVASKQTSKNTVVEVQNEKASKHVQNVAKRLQGKLDDKSVPLSIEGQVRKCQNKIKRKIIADCVCVLLFVIVTVCLCLLCCVVLFVCLFVCLIFVFCCCCCLSFYAQNFPFIFSGPPTDHRSHRSGEIVQNVHWMGCISVINNVKKERECVCVL